jgi:hypothetical protein
MVTEVNNGGRDVELVVAVASSRACREGGDEDDDVLFVIIRSEPLCWAVLGSGCWACPGRLLGSPVGLLRQVSQVSLFSFLFFFCFIFPLLVLFI